MTKLIIKEWRGECLAAVKGNQMTRRLYQAAKRGKVSAEKLSIIPLDDIEALRNAILTGKRLGEAGWATDLNWDMDELLIYKINDSVNRKRGRHSFWYSESANYTLIAKIPVDGTSEPLAPKVLEWTQSVLARSC